MTSGIDLIEIGGWLWLMRDIEIATGLGLLLYMTRGVMPRTSRRVSRDLLTIMLLETLMHAVWLWWRRGDVDGAVTGLVFTLTAAASVVLGIFYLIHLRLRAAVIVGGGP